MLGIVAVGVVRESRIFFRAPMYRAHCAVIFATAQISCFALLLRCSVYRVELGAMMATYFAPSVDVVFGVHLSWMVSEISCLVPFISGFRSLIQTHSGKCKTNFMPEVVWHFSSLGIGGGIIVDGVVTTIQFMFFLFCRRPNIGDDKQSSSNIWRLHGNAWCESCWKAVTFQQERWSSEKKTSSFRKYFYTVSPVHLCLLTRSSFLNLRTLVCLSCTQAR